MSILGVLATLSLLSGSAIAQITAASCTLTDVYSWTYNSLNQSPCTVAAYLQSTCNGGSFTISPLLSGQEYLGPSVADSGNLCKCNTIVYSLVSACGACQSAIWTDWSSWATNCTKVLAPGSFPNAVPSGTAVPQWALADVTREDLALWDSLKAMAIGDEPEIGAGALIGTNSSTGGPTGTSAADPTIVTPLSYPTVSSNEPHAGDSPNTGSTTKSKSSHTAAIVGGAVGGAAVVVIAVITIALLMRRQHPTPAPGPYMASAASQPLYDAQKPVSEVATLAPSTAETPVMPMKVYNPNDVTTFPGYQESQQVPEMPAQPPFQPYNAPGNTMANMPTTMPHGYSGLPTV